jgi:hypothetical protein
VSHSSPPVPPDPAFRQQFGRSRGLLTGPAIVVAVIALWVGVVQLGRSPAEPVPPEPSRPAAVTPPDTPPASLLPPPMLQLFGPVPEERVLIRDRRLREVDLATGALSEPIGETGYLDRMLALPDGGYVCICVRQRTRGEERSNEIDLHVFHRNGDEVSTFDVGTWVGTDLPGLHQEPGPFSMEAAHSADGRHVAITTALRRPPEWLREVVLIDLEAAEVAMRVDLPPTPSAQGRTDAPAASPKAGGPRWAWAPIPRFSPDGTRLLLTSVELDEPDGAVSHAAQVLQLTGPNSGSVLALGPDGPGNDPTVDSCRESAPQWAADDLIVTLCFGDRYTGPFMRRQHPDGSRMRRISLRDALKDSAAPELLTDGQGRAWLWDAWSTRALRVNLEDGVVEATTAMPNRGRPDRFVFPSATMTPDGSRLIVAASAPGDAPGTIYVLDAESLVRVSEWAAEPGLMSLGVSGDGLWLHLAYTPDWDGAGVARTPARMVVIEIATGTVRARLGQLGDSAFSIVERRKQED